MKGEQSTMAYEVIGTKKKGSCNFCTGRAKERPLFIVRGPISGEICAEHLHILASQRTDQPAQPFDRVSADGRE